jgi:hypothetical protein
MPGAPRATSLDNEQHSEVVVWLICTPLDLQHFVSHGCVSFLEGRQVLPHNFCPAELFECGILMLSVSESDSSRNH